MAGTSLKFFRGSDNGEDGQCPLLTFAQRRSVNQAGFQILKAEQCYHVLLKDNSFLGVKQCSLLATILKCQHAGAAASGAITTSTIADPPEDEAFVVEVGPRQQFTSSASTHSVSIARGVGLDAVERIEVTKRFLVKSGGPVPGAKENFVALVHDRMTEMVYELDARQTIFAEPGAGGGVEGAAGTQGGLVETVPLLANGKAALEA